MDRKQDIQLAFVNGLKAVDNEKELTEEQRWDLWYEAELKALAEAMFDMTDKDFYNNDYTPIKKCSTMN